MKTKDFLEDYKDSEFITIISNSEKRIVYFGKLGTLRKHEQYYNAKAICCVLKENITVHIK